MGKTYKIVSWPFKACMWLIALVTFVLVYSFMLLFLPLAVAFDLALCSSFEEFKESMRQAYVDMPLDYIKEMLLGE